MNDPFDLPVTYQVKGLLFPAQLLQLVYIHKFQIDVYGTEVLYERDEEGSCRALGSAEGLSRDIDQGLLQVIAEAIEAVLK